MAAEILQMLLAQRGGTCEIRVYDDGSLDNPFGVSVELVYGMNNLITDLTMILPTPAASGWKSLNRSWFIIPILRFIIPILSQY